MAAGAASWVAPAQGVTAAAAATAKTMLNVISASNRSIKLTELGVGFVGGTSGTAKPVLVELCRSTQAGAGSGSSAVTFVGDDTGNADTVQATSAKGYTGEPTTLTIIRTWRVHPQSLLLVQFPLGREPRANNGAGLCIRVTFDTAETTLSGDYYMVIEE